MAASYAAADQRCTVGTRLPPRGLEPLTDSINAFIESERENLERQRNTLADLAHSLKTPIAVLRTQMDSGAGDGALREELDVQLQRMNNLVSYQLARAASSGHKLFSAPLPSSSCRSPGSPWKRAAGSISNSHSTPLEA